MHHADEKRKQNIEGVSCPDIADSCLWTLTSLVNLLRDDIRVSVLLELSVHGSCSLTALSRRLKVGYRKIRRALEQLEYFGLVQVSLISIDGNQKYKFYSVNEELRCVLKNVLK